MENNAAKNQAKLTVAKPSWIENFIFVFVKKNNIRLKVIVINDEKTIDLNLNIDEGNKYYFGDISYIGNSSFTNFQLDQILGIEKGDSYNGVLLKERIQDEKPDANDLTNLYQNNGYLFSNINAVEVSALDIEAILNTASEFNGEVFSRSVNPTEPESKVSLELVTA